MHYIWKEWKENLRGKGLWLSLGIFMLVSVSVYFRMSTLSFDQGFYVLLINLFDTLIYLIPILSLFIGAFSVFQEKEQKTLIMLLTKKESSFSFLYKKSLAIYSVNVIPFITWFLLYLVLLKFNFYIDLKSYFIFICALITMMIIFLQIGVMIASYCRSRMQMIGIVISIWFYFFFLHDFLLLSFLPDITHENVKWFSIAYFLNPLQAVRMFLEAGMGVYSFGHMSRLLQAFMWTKPVYFLIGNTLFWISLSFSMAVLLHRKEGSS